jgi:chorismate mutase
MFKLFSLTLLSSVFITGYTASPLDTIINLMAKRASLMKNVASCKWHINNQVSAYSAKQEVAVLQNAKEVAHENNLNVNSLLIFIQMQMDLSKQVEAYWISHWNSSNINNQSNKYDLDCLSNLRLKIQKIDEKLYPMISRNLAKIKIIPSNILVEKLNEYFINSKGKRIKGIPEKPDYLGLIATSLKGIQKINK